MAHFMSERLTAGVGGIQLTWQTYSEISATSSTTTPHQTLMDWVKLLKDDEVMKMWWSLPPNATPVRIETEEIWCPTPDELKCPHGRWLWDPQTPTRPAPTTPQYNVADYAPVIAIDDSQPAEESQDPLPTRASIRSPQ